MAMHASRLTQDQNLNVHFDGVKINAQKNKGGLGGRNSGKPSALQPSKKHNTKNVIPIGEDSIVTKKAPVSGRKALGDLTNSAIIPSSQKKNGLKKMSQKSKKAIIAFADDEKFPYSIAEEGFIHNHDECIKAQMKSMGLNEFDEDACFQSVSACNSPPKEVKDESPMMSPIFEMEEMLKPIFGSPVSPKLNDYGFVLLTESPSPSPFKLKDRVHGGMMSRICGSPVSPKMNDYGFVVLTPAASPNFKLKVV